MATHRIPYLVPKPGAKGPRYFWQPSQKLRAAGWRQRRLADEIGHAIAEAEAFNARLDAWRRAGADPAQAAAFQFPASAEASAGRPDPAEASAAAADKEPHAEPGTLGAVIVAYKRSPAFLELAPKTRRSYRQNLDILWAWGHDHRLAAITPLRCKKLYQAWRPRTPSRAVAIVVMGRTLLKWAISEDLAAANPFKDVPVKTTRPDRDLLWTAEAIAAFDAAAIKQGWPSLGDAVVINHWLGQREGDILTLPLPKIEGGWIHVRQSKTGKRVALPISKVPELAARIEAARQRTLKTGESFGITPSTLLVCETTGRPWGEDHFRHKLAEVRAVAAERQPTVPLATDPAETAPFTALTFQLLRHTAVCALAGAGCEDTLIRSVTGHSLGSVNAILERYLVRSAQHAGEAFAKRLAHETASAAEEEET